VPRHLKITLQVLDQLLVHARAERPRECCGLLAGPQETITEALPTANALESPYGFFVAPAELISSLRGLRGRGLKHLGLYHSHPEGENTPSRIDLEMAFYPACAYVIISPGPLATCPVRAFDLATGHANELAIEAITPSL
jgi:proteasome lid subunit RPN8/RPN11